jgi:hypothetical protein
MAASNAQRNPIFAADVRQLGVVVSVHTDRSHPHGEPIFRVSHISGGGDVAFLSMAILLEDHATAAVKVLGEFVSAGEVKFVP